MKDEDKTKEQLTNELKTPQTQRKRAEEVLWGAQQNFRNSVDNSPLGIRIITADGKLLYANQKFLDICGFSSMKELKATPRKQYYTPQSYAEYQERKEARKLGKPVPDHYEISIVRKDGEVRHLALFRKDIVWNGEVQFQVLYQDITERKQKEEVMRQYRERLEELVKQYIVILGNTNGQLAEEKGEHKRTEEKLKESQETIQRFFECCTDAMIIVNLDGIITDANAKAVSYLALGTKEDLISRNALEFCADNDRERAYSEMHRAMQGIHILPDEFNVLRADGTTFTGEVTYTVPTDSAGKITGCCVIIRDVTERRHIGKHLEDLYKKEKHLRRELQAEIKKRSEFTRVLVHELKTPLTPLLVSSEALAREVRGVRNRRLATNVQRGALYLNDRIDELLDLAKGEIGALQLNLEKIDPLPILREIVEEASVGSSSEGQWLSLDVPHSLPLILADIDRFRQILFNLINNAVKFNSPGGKVTVRAKEDSAFLLVEIEDTGRGITKKDQERLFQPYHQKDIDRIRLSGMGLGLVLSKTLIELQRGNIWLKSAKNKGSTFSFKLPLASA